MAYVMGHETCERLLPTKIFVEERLKSFFDGQIVFLTPLVTEKGLLSLKETLVLLRKEDEVFVNDLGVLFFCSQQVAAKIFIGRILFSQLLDMFDATLSKQVIERCKTLFNNKIVGIELDKEYRQKKLILAQDVFEQRFCQRPKIISVTRRCIFNRASRSLDQFAMCQKECLKGKVIARNEALEKMFVFSGNAIYMP